MVTHDTQCHAVDVAAQGTCGRGRCIVNPRKRVHMTHMIHMKNSVLKLMVGALLAVCISAQAQQPARAQIATTKVVTHLLVEDNIFETKGTSAGTGPTLISTDQTTNSGVIASNKIFNLDATTEILCTANSGFHFFDNRSTAATDASGYLLPAADA